MKTAALFVILCSLISSITGEAQVAAASHPPSISNVRILAIGRFNGTPTPEQLQILSLRWYVTGKIDQWFSPQDGNGVVMILKLSSVEEARAMLDTSFPGQPQLLSFEFVPVEPLIPLTRLLSRPAGPPK